MAGSMVGFASLGARQLHLPQIRQTATCARRPFSARAIRASATPLGRDETREEALQRRLRESQRVEERIIQIYNEDDFNKQMAKVGDGLVVLEVESEQVCQTGLEEEAELHWKADKEAALAPCREIKHVFQRTARDCPDVTFLSLLGDSDEGQELCDKLGVEVLPTLQFYKGGQKLWEHKGILHLEQDLGEGVLYYGDAAANGAKASDFVEELRSRADFDSFLAKQDEKVLTVVAVVLTNATPCVKVFPAIVALAKSFKGYAAFARLTGDENVELQALTTDELNVVQVPTFIFYRAGKEVGRHVGSSRGDLIGQILQQQNALGIAPPTPQRPAKKAVPKPKRKANAWG